MESNSGTGFFESNHIMVLVETLKKFHTDIFTFTYCATNSSSDQGKYLNGLELQRCKDSYKKAESELMTHFGEGAPQAAIFEQLQKLWGTKLSAGVMEGLFQ